MSGDPTPSPIPRSLARPCNLSFTCARLSAHDSHTSRVASGRGARAPHVQDGLGGRVDDAGCARGHLWPRPRCRGRFEWHRLESLPAVANHWLASADRLFALGLTPPTGAMAPAVDSRLRQARQVAQRLRNRRHPRRWPHRDLHRLGAPRPWDPILHTYLPCAAACGWSCCGRGCRARSGRAHAARTPPPPPAPHAAARSRTAGLRASARVRPCESLSAARSLLARAQVPQSRDRGRRARWATRCHASGERPASAVCLL